ncbi:helix-turn-helix domain-containing protein [Streptomyces albipurpureus]|uniref:XRE family transcriptional regulator n=1 Tax=Streptomyces albipurpureus TaxID=2897419 RepID=A0ABT0UQ65_9ACTN|nr:XRE family transcriptional regulator [Streptomyces sp. CWNU-1]MCM2389381.1 XRE family transcriptional regulator [Streptomyces sp. CWNU-1]
MPRWKALPDELDPEVRDFAEHLRRLVDRSGLSIAAVSDRTGYSKTSWERYLNGRILAPKGAVVALAEVTGTSTIHLTTLWELAERAWSRAEMRHDRTMEQIRISQARAALGDFGSTGPGGSPAAGSPSVGGPPVSGQPGGPFGGQPGSQPGGRSGGRTSAGQTGGGTPAGVPPYTGQAGSMGQTASRGGHRAAPTAARRQSGGGNANAGHGPGKRKVGMFLGGVVGALAVIAGAVLLTDLGGARDKTKNVAATPSPAASTGTPTLPAGVKCSGKDCTGEDPETMGCGGEFAKTTATVLVGEAKVEVRYSEICKAAWARITAAAPGDTVEISVRAKGRQTGLVNADKDAYTPMTAVAAGAEPKACAIVQATGTKKCTGAQ